MDDLMLIEQQLNSEERLIRDSVTDYITNSFLPKITDSFEQAYFPEEIIAEISSLGLFGMTIPKQYGGLEASYVSYGLVCQELERGDSGLRSFVSVQSSLCMYPIATFGSEQQKSHWLPQLASGKAIGCFGLTEPDTGSDPSSMRTTAKRQGDGWLLNGAKMWITNSPIADLAIVWAGTSDGIRGFLVEKDTPGFSTNEIKHKMSLRASITGEIVLQNCLIPEENMLPGSSIGIAAALKCLTQARYGISWGAIGAAMACFDTAVNYCNERKQFGKPISGFQLVQKDLVKMYSEIIKSQLLNLQLGRLFDAKQANHNMVSLAKMNACQQALNIARSARNLLGANGISLEYPVIRHMLNLESVYTYEGTDNIHTLILGKHITGMDAFK